jgi:hypothetical protein
MDGRVPRAQYPIWVKISLWGVPGRRGLWMFVALSIACGLASMIYGLWQTKYFIGGLLAVAAIPYWLSIRWIDAHGSWEPETKGHAGR